VHPLWNRLRAKFVNNEEVIQEPEQPQQEEITRSIETITLQEQLQIMKQVDQYMKEYEPPYIRNREHYEKGFSMKNDVFVTEGEEPISRCNLEVFYQSKETTDKEVSYLISLIKFGDEEWKVFQVK
jgi:hypothetical protein